MKQLEKQLTARNKAFSGTGFMPVINLNLNLQLSDLQKKVAEEKPKKKTVERNGAEFAQMLADKLREKPLYTSGTSQHVGGG